MEEEIINLINLMAEEAGEENAMREVLLVIGKKLAIGNYPMGEAMNIAETEVANGWQQQKKIGEDNEEV